jgi:segregation and condensation protein B
MIPEANYSMKDLNEIKSEKSLPALIETLLFISTSPISISQLAKGLDESEKKIKDALDQLDEYYTQNRGLVLQWHQNKVQLTSAPFMGEIIENFLGIEIKTTLTHASLEAMAIIAYKQPITRPEIDEIRGVNSDGVVRNLLSKGLIEEVGRREGVGRPVLYGTTTDFLSYFGLSSLEDLPSFEVLPLQSENGQQILKD